MPAPSSIQDKAANWQANLARYKAFVAEHGDGSVAYIKKYDKSLAIWVNRTKSDWAAGAVPAERAAALAAAGITPAQPAVRRSKDVVSQSRAETLAELQAFVRTHGHACLPQDASKASLHHRVMTLRSVAKQRDPVLLETLTRLGVFKRYPRRYPDAAWEAQFAVWREYVARTGDFRCEVAPPKEVRAWTFSVREQLALLSMPLPWLDCDRKHLRKASRERACVLHAIGRLAAAGFTVERKPLSESDLLAARLTKLCSLPPLILPLRTVLRVLTHRQRAGRMSPAMATQLQASGLVWCPVRQVWRQASAAYRVAGALVKTPKRTKSAANKRMPARAQPGPDFAHTSRPTLAPSPTLAVKTRVAEILSELAEPTSQRQLFTHPGVRGLRSGMNAARLRSELSLVTALLHKEGKITFLQGMDPNSSWSKFLPTPCWQIAA